MKSILKNEWTCRDQNQKSTETRLCKYISIDNIKAKH